MSIPESVRTTSAGTNVTIEPIPLGSLSCEFIGRTDFTRLLATWLTGSEFKHVVTLNPEMVMQAQHDDHFRKAVTLADIRVPDGAGLVWARWFIRSDFWSLLPSLLAFPFVSVERIPGVEVVEDIAKLCQENQQSLYLLGGASEHTRATAQHLAEKFPGLTVYTGRDHAYESLGPADILTDIAEKQPAVLLVAYGAPRQTIWIEQNRRILESAGVRIAVGVGGAFAILSERTPRAPLIMRRLNAEWLWRLVLEPSRLPRIWRATVQFPRLIAAQKQLSHT